MIEVSTKLIGEEGCFEHLNFSFHFFFSGAMYTMYIFWHSDVERRRREMSTSSRKRLDAEKKPGGLGIVGRQYDRGTSSS